MTPAMEKYTSAKTTFSFRLPFPRINGSVHTQMLDRIINEVQDSHDVAEIEIAYAKAWVEELAAETGFTLSFDKMHPGNRIYASIPITEFENLHAGMTESEAAEWRALVMREKNTAPMNRNMFGKSGIIPHPFTQNDKCSWDVRDWGPVKTWNTAQCAFFLDFSITSDQTILAERIWQRLHDVLDFVDMPDETDRNIATGNTINPEF